MPQISVNGIQLEYQEMGSKNDPPMILIMGLGNQLTSWPEDFCSSLAQEGFRLILFDNRDVGLSTKFAKQRAPNILAVAVLARLGIKLRLPYTLEDMAADTVGLMDVLEIDSAHIAGISMGGMIAQIVAARYQERVKSLTCLITSSGNQKLPLPKREVIKKLLARPQGLDKEEWENYYVEMFTLIGSPEADQDELRQRIRLNVNRSLYPQGTARQLAAILQNGSRVKLLKEITAPTLVISGSVDPLVPYQGGEDIAAHVPNARFELIERMGHDLPPHLIPRLVELISRHAQSRE